MLLWITSVAGKESNMKSQTNTNLVIRSTLALAVALAIWSPVRAQSAEPAEGKSLTQATMMKRCRELNVQKQQLKEDIKAQNAQLTEQLAEMNRAPEDKKVDLMAGVLTHMVQQRIAMDARKAKMEDEMMQHMMQHMMMGKESLSQCPMMKGMKDMDKSSPGAGTEPQDEQK
jgi:hypothetical protein